MIAQDYEAFIKAWSTMIELQAGKDLSDRALKLAFGLLLDYELTEIKQALRVHCLKSPYIAKPADIVAIVRGVLPSNSELYGLAQGADTLMGAYVRHLIGEHDIRHLAARDASSRVSSHRITFEAFIERAQSGSYTDTEIRLLGGKGFDMTAELCPGLPGARSMYHERLRIRQADLVKVQIETDAPTTAEKVHTPRSESETEAGKQRLAALMAELATSPDPVQPQQELHS